MKLRRLKVEQLRQFRQPMELTDLTDGINVFTGPNESGKSTLVRAIRAAFFERHKSSSVGDLQPWGDSAATPSIELEFEWQGQSWRLVKSFLKKKRCDLTIGQRAYSGEEAEDQLAELLGYEFAGKGVSQAKHWGIPGLLWIEQGAGQQIREQVGHASGHLKAALGESLGEVASSAGDALIDQIRALRGALLTGTGRPTGDFAKLLAAHEEATQDRASLHARVNQYREQVDRLAQLRTEQAQAEQERIWETYRQQADIAAKQLAEVQAWQQAQQRDQRALTDCLSTISARRDLLATLAARTAQRDQRSTTLKSAAQALQTLQGQTAPLAETLRQAETAYELARQSLKQARDAEQREQLARERQQLEEDIAALSSSLEKARELHTDLLNRRLTLQTAEIDPRAVAELRETVEELQRLRLREEMLATRLRYELSDDNALSLNGDALRGQGERLLLAPGELRIAGVGKLEILPGGRDIGELQREKQTLEERCSALFTRLEVSSLEQAEQRQAQARELRDAIVQDERLLATLAPEGIEALDARGQLKQSRKQDVEALLRKLAEASESTPSLARAEAQLEAAEAALRDAQSQASEHREALGLARHEAESAAKELQQLEAELASPERQQREQQAGEQLLELRAHEAQLTQSIQTRQQQIDAARPDMLQQDIERLTGSAAAAEKIAEQRRLELERLQASLEALGAEGLEEQLAELDSQLDRLTRRKTELQTRAAALDLLLDRLQAQRLAVTRQLQEPLQRHLNRYLQLLFPQASLTVNEQLVPEVLIRRGSNGEEQGDFEALSFGAREQMGLISRLAYADLLQEAGRPTLIILDDALVHSDSTRLAQMKRILFDAAQRHQILLFSCHPENWRDLGAAPRELAISQGRSYHESPETRG